MQPAPPFYREAGPASGPGVVCLHANASSSNQWRALMDRLAPDFHVLAADAYDAGKSPAWPLDRYIELRDEAAFLEPVFQRAGPGPMTLVGHSYGAAVALVAAVLHPQRVRALALYEPTLFALLDAESPPPSAADGIRAAVAGSQRALAAGDGSEAARCFIDYWMGDGAWASTPEARKGPIQESVTHVSHWASALLGETTPLHAFAQLQVPVLYMTGGKSPASSLGVARLLTQALPSVQVVEFADLGHMGPVTHPELVNEAIARFLMAQGAG
jgi:pimeloyl-ACP methyl ester carboxylesterase